MYQSGEPARGLFEEAIAFIFDFRHCRCLGCRFLRTRNEDSIEDCSHRGSVSREVLSESRQLIRWTVITAAPSEQFESLPRSGQCMSLCAVFHLQAMLDGSQECVGGRQMRALGFAQIVLFGKSSENDQRLSGANPRLASAVL